MSYPNRSCGSVADQIDVLHFELGYDETVPLQSIVADGPGNLPIAVVQTVALGAPFNPDQDVELGVAYISYVQSTLRRRRLTS